MHVTIIIPTFNRAHLIEKAIHSVLNQTYPDIEVLVVDDGSTDDTRAVVGNIAEKHPHVRYLYKKNGGCASALNAGVQNSIGELVGWLSSDDWYDYEENTLVEKAVAVHKENPMVGFTYADFSLVEPHQTTTYDVFDAKTREEHIKQHLELCYVNGSSVIIKRRVFYVVGFFNEFFKYGQDYDFYFRILSQFDIQKVKYDKKPMLNYFYDSAHECLGTKITNKEHDNESWANLERHKLALQPRRPTCCAMLCVKNESELIDQCLNDLSMFVDHIVILDDGSEDNTVALASKWGKVRAIYQQPPKPVGVARSEGKDRQRLLEMAYKTRADFFLFVDCDEVFEDSFKTEIHKMMRTPGINLWFFHEVNFWRSKTHHRVDELYDKGWFGRLFRSTPGLQYNPDGEHCCGVPNNIPETNPWFNNEPTQRKAASRVKHYGFCTEERILRKFRNLWIREAGRISLEQRHQNYDRLLDETTLTLQEYYTRPYWLKDTDPPVKFVSGDDFGRSETMAKELALVLAGEGIYSK